MKIRPIEKKDDKIIEGIIRDCLTEYGAAGRMDTAWGDPYLDRFSEIYVNDNDSYWVAENDEGQVVAGVGIGPLAGAEGICEMQKMYCKVEYRGTGIANKLMETALEFARAHYKQCYLETMENMERAKSFYEKYGFVHTCDTIGSTGHCGCDYHYILDL